MSSPPRDAFHRRIPRAGPEAGAEAQADGAADPPAAVETIPDTLRSIRDKLLGLFKLRFPTAR